MSEPLRIEVFVHNESEKLDTILTILQRLDTKENTIMADLTALTTQVAQTTSVEQSAITLIQGLAAQITAAGTDPVALASLTASLNTSATALAAAEIANTPVTTAQAKATS